MAAVLDEIGGLLGTESFRADPGGYSELLSWLEAFGDVAKVGVEGTGSYGAGIARFLARAGGSRRRGGPSDPPGATTGRQVRPP